MSAPAPSRNPLWRLPEPFTAMQCVEQEEIDEYLHVNNTVYLRWLDAIAWAHSTQLGISLEHCLEIRRGMAIRHTRVDYLDAALPGDSVLIGTWIVSCDGRLRCSRRFEILRIADGRRLLDAEIDYFCLNLDTGGPCRFPAEFTRCYQVKPAVAKAYAHLPAGARHVGHPKGGA